MFAKYQHHGQMDLNKKSGTWIVFVVVLSYDSWHLRNVLVGGMQTYRKEEKQSVLGEIRTRSLSMNQINVKIFGMLFVDVNHLRYNSFYNQPYK